MTTSLKSASKASLKLIRLAGVPEQVNIPITLCKERGIFERYGLDVQYIIVPEGTGKMLDKLEASEVDIAITVTDATIAGRANGRKIQLCGTFVESPLVWSVLTSPRNSSIQNLEGLSNLERQVKIGISRKGSGSHTMAFYTSLLHKLDCTKLDFKVENTFQGLRESVLSERTDLFLWESFTSKPYVDSGLLRKIGEVHTPWTAFSFACRDFSQPDSKGEHVDFLANEVMARSVREALFPALYEGMVLFTAIQEGSCEERKFDPEMVNMIARDFGHSSEDAVLWLSRCRYSSSREMTVHRIKTLESVGILKDAGVVDSAFDVDLLWNGNPIISLTT